MKIAKLFTFLILASIVFFSCSKQTTQNIDLSGEWQFQMDPDDVGEQQNWFNADLPETVKLPGSMVENGKGYAINLETKWTGGMKKTEWYKYPEYEPYHDSTNIRFPYWLQPDKKYTGAAWYRKTIVIPEKWEGKTVWLNLERPHWESVVWVNGTKIAMQNSLATPHRFNISNYLQIGENQFAIRIDNRTKDIDVGLNSHSISDHTQSNWNGIVGDIALEIADAIYIENVRVFPEVKNKTVEIVTIVNNTTLQEEMVNVEVESKHKQTEIESAEKQYEFSIVPGENIVKMTYSVEDAKLWDEFTPNVYELLLELSYNEGENAKRIDFGFRDFKAGASGFMINERPVFLRGTLECAIFPKTGYPPCDVAGCGPPLFALPVDRFEVLVNGSDLPDAITFTIASPTWDWATNAQFWSSTSSA